MTAVATSAVSQLLLHIDKLRALHRAAESPTFGQVELLFDLADATRRALLSTDQGHHARWPTTATSVEQAARQLVAALTAEIRTSGGGA